MAETKDFMAIEDGQVFLSQEELDDYRDQKMQSAYANGLLVRGRELGSIR